MTLRAGPLEHDATLPDGRVVRVRIGLPEDGYIRARELRTVTVELYGNGEHLAAVSSILEPEQEDEARAMLRRIVAGLESGELPPTTKQPTCHNAAELAAPRNSTCPACNFIRIIGRLARRMSGEPQRNGHSVI